MAVGAGARLRSPESGLRAEPEGRKEGRTRETFAQELGSAAAPVIIFLAMNNSGRSVEHGDGGWGAQQHSETNLTHLINTSSGVGSI